MPRQIINENKDFIEKNQEFHLLKYQKFHQQKLRISSRKNKNVIQKKRISFTQIKNPIEKIWPAWLY